MTGPLQTPTAIQHRRAACCKSYHASNPYITAKLVPMGYNSWYFMSCLPNSEDAKNITETEIAILKGVSIMQCTLISATFH